MKLSEPLPVKVGVLGCSDIAVRKFIPALMKSETAVLAAMSSISNRHIPAIASTTGCSVMGHEQLLAHTDIDLVYISLPNHLHEAWTIRALQAGKHVICEKPLGLSLASVRRMLDCADRHKLLLMENLMFLHHPQHTEVKAILERGDIGTLLELRACFGIPNLLPDNFRLDPDQGGGAFHDMARYPLATALYFLHDDEFSFTGCAQYRGRLNTAVCGTAATSSGRMFSYTMRFRQQYECWYELVGSSGIVRLDRAFTTPATLENVITVTTGTGRTEQAVPPADHFRCALEHACSLIAIGSGYEAVHARSHRIAQLAEQMMKGCTHVAIS